MVDLVAGILMVPAMLSKAELATAMPRAGGSYYFLDRAMGPLVGTVGGLGTWIAFRSDLSRARKKTVSNKFSGL